MLSGEDKKDVSRVMGKSMAKKVSSATNDSKSKALDKVKSKIQHGKQFRKDHERLTKAGQTSMDYPSMRTYTKHLKKAGKIVEI